MQRKAVTGSLYLRFVIAVFCAFNMMMFSYPIYASYFESDTQGFASLFSWLSLLTALPVMTYCAWPIVDALMQKGVLLFAVDNEGHTALDDVFLYDRGNLINLFLRHYRLFPENVINESRIRRSIEEGKWNIFNAFYFEIFHTTPRILFY